MSKDRIKFIRTLHNQLIIGTVFNNGNAITVNDPYNVVPGVDGIQIYPMDEEIVGRKIETIELYKSALMYYVEPSEELKDAYSLAMTGIETEAKPQLII